MTDGFEGTGGIRLIVVACTVDATQRLKRPSRMDGVVVLACWGWGLGPGGQPAASAREEEVCGVPIGLFVAGCGDRHSPALDPEPGLAGLSWVWGLAAASFD